MQRGEHGSNVPLLALGRVELFWRSRRGKKRREDSREPVAAGLPPPLVQSLARRRPVDPTLCPVSMGTGISAPLQKNVDGNLLRAGLVVNHAANDAGNALIVSGKQIVETRKAAVMRFFRKGQAHCVHNPRTSDTQVLWRRRTGSARATIQPPRPRPAQSPATS